MSHIHTGPLPPEMASHVAGPQRIAAQLRDLEIAEREQILAWAMVFCSCRMTTWGPGMPPVAGCPVHGQHMTTWDGRTL